MFAQKTAPATPAPAPTQNETFLHKLPGGHLINKLPAPVRDFVERRPVTSAGIAILAGLGLLSARRRSRHI